MRLKFRHIKHTLFYSFILVGCIDPYKPKMIEEDINALVVDGFVNTTTNTVNVSLSRTLPLMEDYAYEPVTNADVNIEGEDGSSFLLYNNGDGKYSLDELSLNESVKYRLYVNRSGSEYRSEFITLKPSPSLDEITWEISPDNDGIQIYVDAHDPTSKTRYYQWVFTETWEYATEFISSFILENGELRIRNDNEFTNICWATDLSDKILINQTTHLTNDVVHKFPIQFISRNSVKIARGYSILVQQRALDENAYNYLQQLQRTTEVMGGLFDPMPSQVTGNMYNVNDGSEPVIGYFRGGAVQEKRLFITRAELAHAFPPYQTFSCSVDTVFSVEALQALQPHYQPLYDLMGAIFIAPISCVDCRVIGKGVLTKPDFWP
ncbi:MAG: DUF4249 domain-containing protein [Cyclobacteriaceae bacterium]|nr:DUF4249 domain-containing protein [Cyclobacteriaceae bacterium]